MSILSFVYNGLIRKKDFKLSYDVDYIDGKEIPQLVLTEDYTISNLHKGTVHVKSGTLTIRGELQGTLDVQNGSKVIIFGKQNGTVSIDDNGEIIIYGEINGTTSISYGSVVTIEEGGKLAGSLTNNGKLIIRGIFGGSQSGNGKIIIEGCGRIKQPIIKDGIYYYEW